MIKPYSIRKVNSSDFKLGLLFIVITSLIILRSYFDPNGSLTVDSSHYLQLAQNLLDGKGFYRVDLLRPDGIDRILHWPYGYPVLIFIVAKITTLSVYLSSKLLNIILIASILLLFRKLFKEKAYWFGFILMFYSIIEIYTETWSEGAFIVGLLWFCFSIYYYLYVKENLASLINILLSGLFLFMIRYIGIFCFTVTGLLANYYLYKRNYPSFLKFSIITLILGGFTVSFSYFNHIITFGHSFEISTFIPPVPKLEIIKNLINAQIHELIFFRGTSFGNHIFQFLIILIELGLVVFLIFKAIKKETSPKENGLWRVFLLTGIMYWLILFLIIFSNPFEGFSNRLLGPSSFLLFLSFFTFLYAKKVQLVAKSKNIFFLLVILFFIDWFPNKNFIYNKLLNKNISNNYTELCYSNNLKNIKESVDTLPKNSLVAFAPIHLNYLRPDITSVDPLFKPYAKENETMDNFIDRINKLPIEHFYIMINKDFDYHDYDESVRNYIEQNKSNVLVKIK